MPVDLGYFIIKKPRVSPINAVDTIPPSSQGTLSVYDAFSLLYTGTAYSAILNLTGSKILTLINENPAHADNLNLDILGKSIKDLVSELNGKNNYSCVLLTSESDSLCLFKGIIRQDILGNPYTVKFNKELEYLVDVDTEGKLGSCSVDSKKGDFKYSDVDSRWMTNEGFIFDQKEIPVPNNGVVPIGSDGVEIIFSPATSVDKKDLNKTVSFTNLELTPSLSFTTAQTPFQAAPILENGTLELKINQVVKTEGLDYKVLYGTLPEIRAKNPEPYIITSSTNTFRLRYDSDDIQEFVIPEGTYFISDLAKIINPTALNFQVMEYKDDETKLKYFTVQAFRGTFYHQLRIEDGSFNQVLGLSDFTAKKGDGSGTINFLTPVFDEIYVPTEKINSLVVSGTKAITGNPFIGVNTDGFILYENDSKKIKDVNFFVDSYGTVVFSDIVIGENLTGGILKKDTNLFLEDYAIYADGKKLVENLDYVITPEAGWITLTSSAFPGSVYTADYSHETYGKIVGDVLLGEKAVVTGTKKSPFAFDSSNNNLIFEVNGVETNINLPLGTGIKITDIVSVINNSGTDYVASVLNYGLSISTRYAGANRNIKIKQCSANTVLGFTPNQSSIGKGAVGGEQALEITKVPLLISGFVAPSGGDTIIIKNNDVRSRYPTGAILNIANDYYEVSTSFLVTEANIIGNVSEPYTILEGSNDLFSFYIDDVEYSVKFVAGFKISIRTIVNQINAVKSGSAEVMDINGTLKIKMKGSTKVVIGNGTANRSLGFDYKSEDTSSADTYIKTTSKFKNTYIAPDLYTTITPVNFEKDSSVKEITPKNSNTILFIGDQTSKYEPKTLVKFNSVYYYTVLGSSYDSDLDKTTITFLSPLELPVYPDTLCEYTTEPIVNEGEVKFKTKFYPNLDQPYALLKNNNLLIVDKDYEIDNSGYIELKKGISSGDVLEFGYIAKRFIGPETKVRMDYTYYDYLSKGSNIKISFKARNPDNFFIKVQHGTNLMKSYQKELTERNQSIANSSSSGFPTGEIPTQDMSQSGSDSYPYRLAIIDEKIELANKWFSFFDNRLYFFEKEREIINGYLVGAEDGRVTNSDISDSANTPPTRLFPYPDTRLEEQKNDPYRVPALDGYNKNDLGSATYGFTASSIDSVLTDENSSIDLEISKLNTLLGYSTTNGYLASTGSFDITSSGETLTMYVEIRAGVSFTQHIITASFSENYMAPIPDPLGGGDIGGGHSPQTATYIAGQINAAFSSLGVSPAYVSGSSVVLGTNSSNALCIHIVSDAPHVGFGTGNCSAIRSRHTLWTGGYSDTYSMAVPGTSSVHLDISSENVARSKNSLLHSNQLSLVQGQMDEWLEPFDLAFPFSKTERANIDAFLETISLAIDASNNFDSIKSISQNPLDSIDNPTVLTDRISYLAARKNLEVIPRKNRVIARLVEIQDALVHEALYDPRYVWLSVLTNKNDGLYASRKVEIDNEARKQREAARNSATLGSISSFS